VTTLTISTSLLSSRRPQID